MFKTIQIIVMAVFCLNFSTIAQENKAIDVTSKGIQIGQKVPDITITNLHNYKDKNGKPATTAKLSDFKGKLLILDFWATWCSPCIAMIPKMDALQKQFGDKIQFLSITFQSESEVLPFLSKFEKQHGKHYDLPLVTDSKELHGLFPHIYLPHYVWIDQTGIVKVITEAKELTAENIGKFLVGSNLVLSQKRDTYLNYDRDQPLIINGNGGTGNNLLYHSLICPYTDGLVSGSTVNRNHVGFSKITVTNNAIPELYRVAFGKNEILYANRISLKVRDTTKLKFSVSGIQYLNWLRAGNGFCYEIVVPKSQEPIMHDKMIKELDLYFQDYDIQFTKIKQKCLVLSRVGKLDQLYINGKEAMVRDDRNSCLIVNKPIREFVEMMKFYFQLGPPIIDETGITKNIDLELSVNMTSLSAVNNGLQKYGLKFIEGYRLVKMVVINDAK